MRKTAIIEAIKFHGHLGPYLILGLLAGEFALKKLRCKKYFGLNVMVRGANNKPKSCLIDGLQLSTGATYGKGNIRKAAGRRIAVSFRNVKNDKKFTLCLKKDLIRELAGLKGHLDSERLARKLYNSGSFKVFELTSGE